MPAVTCTEKTPPPGHDTSGNRVRYRAFDVLAASEDDARGVLEDQKGVFRGCVYQNHQGQTIDSWLLCQSLTPRTRVAAPVGGLGLYEIIAEYAWHSFSFAVARRPALITGRARLRIETEHMRVAIDTTPEGVAIVNSANEPFTGASKPVSIDHVILEWVIASTNWITARNQYKAYRDHTNASVWGLIGAEVECALCESIEVEPSTIHHPSYPLLRYYNCRGSFLYSPPITYQGATIPGHHFFSLNWGRRLKTTSGPEPYVLLRDQNGNIDTNGDVLTADGTARDSTKQAYKSYRQVPTIDFNAMNLQLDEDE